MVHKLASETQRTEAVNILRRQIETERQLIKLYSDTRELVIDEQVRRLLHSLQLDSIKHVEMCVTAIEVLEGDVLYGEDRVELEVGLGRHMELEEEAVKRAELLLRNRARRSHHQVLCALVHGERNHFPDILLVEQQHDDAVDARRYAAVGRSAQLECTVQG